MTKLSNLDKFNICSAFTLSNDDIYCLSLLYQPIIGPDAFTLYLTFTSLLERSNLESQSYSHQSLYDTLGFTDKRFLKSREILEGIGLLSTYKKEKEYIYLLCEPLSPKQFLSDGVLGVFLYSKVGEDVFNNLREKFKVKRINKKEYQNISVSFDDVFESKIPGNDKVKTDDYLIDRKPSKKLAISNYEFDFKRFTDSIDTSLIPTGVSDDFRNKILQTATVYSFDEGDMASIFNESIGSDGLLDYQILKKKAKVLYTYKHKEELPKLEIKETVEHDDLFKAIENATGEEFLVSILGDSYDARYLNTLNELLQTLPLNPTVIRLMVMYVVSMLETRNGRLELPPVSYFKKVSDQWVLDDMTDAYKVYNKYILKATDDTPVRKTYKPRKNGIHQKGKFEEENSKKDIMEGMDVL